MGIFFGFIILIVIFVVVPSFLIAPVYRRIKTRQNNAGVHSIRDEQPANLYGEAVGREVAKAMAAERERERREREHREREGR
jgi:hypothetical protein